MTPSHQHAAPANPKPHHSAGLRPGEATVQAIVRHVEALGAPNRMAPYGCVKTPRRWSSYSWTLIRRLRRPFETTWVGAPRPVTGAQELQLHP